MHVTVVVSIRRPFCRYFFRHCTWRLERSQLGGMYEGGIIATPCIWFGSIQRSAKWLVPTMLCDGGKTSDRSNSLLLVGNFAMNT
jgi:hypothetical protein